MKFILTVIGFLFFLNCLTSIALCCTCEYISINEAYKSSNLIFIGKVIDKTFEDESIYVKYRFEIKKVFKGKIHKSVYINSQNTETCGYDFEKGKSYLVYADGDGNYYTSKCTRTNLIDEAFIDLEFLNRLPKSLNRTYLSGRVYFSSKNTITNPYIPTLGTLEVVISNSQTTYTAKVDKKGMYIIEDIFPGKYIIKIKTEKPYDFVSKFDGKVISMISNNEIEIKNEVDIKKNEFYEEDIVITYKSKIDGKILEGKGKPISNVMVELIPEDYFNENGNSVTHFNSYGYWSVDGKFYFENVPPGKYYLGINLRYGDIRNNQYSKIFYPNTANIKKAKLIEIKSGSNINKIKLKVGLKT